jgi:ABC-type dipeptide/oligopeptide/nickel transport system ATPase component
METDGPFLDVELRVDYPSKPQALRHVSFQMQRGEVLGLVGESGSGKSTIALALLKLLLWKEGKAIGNIRFCGRDLLKLPEQEMEKIRGREIGLVLQSPLASLNPALRIGAQLAEAWKAHAKGTRMELAAAVSQALARVGLPHDEEFRRRYPSQISVGQAQRVLVAIAVMHSPSLVIADEPTSALDVMTQVEILQMLAALNRDMGSAVLYISHDLQSVASICQRIAILHAGEIVECGSAESVLQRPQHPYTQRLLSYAPRLRIPLREAISVAQSAWHGGDERTVWTPAQSSPGTEPLGTKVHGPTADRLIETVFQE